MDDDLQLQIWHAMKSLFVIVQTQQAALNMTKQRLDELVRALAKEFGYEIPEPAAAPLSPEEAATIERGVAELEKLLGIDGDKPPEAGA